MVNKQSSNPKLPRFKLIEDLNKICNRRLIRKIVSNKCQTSLTNEFISLYGSTLGTNLSQNKNIEWDVKNLNFLILKSNQSQMTPYGLCYENIKYTKEIIDYIFSFFTVEYDKSSRLRSVVFHGLESAKLNLNDEMLSYFIRKYWFSGRPDYQIGSSINTWDFNWSESMINAIKNESGFDSSMVRDRFISGAFQIIPTLPSLALSENTISKYDELWDWTILSKSTNINWSETLIENHIDKWNWKELSSNPSIPLTDKLINKYKDMWIFDSLTSNKALPWSVDLLLKFESDWCWTVLPYPEYCDVTIPRELIDKHHKNNRVFWTNLSKNTCQNWTADFIKQYVDHWNWSELSKNSGIQWSISLIEEFIDKLDFMWLSTNSALPLSEDFIRSLENNLDFKWLSSNPALSLTTKIVDEYKDRWDFESLSGHPKLNSGFLKKYEHELDWDLLSTQSNLPWNTELAEQYKNRWHWGRLLRNDSIPRSIFLDNDEYLTRALTSLPENDSCYGSMEAVLSFFDSYCWNELTQQDIELLVT